MWKIVSYDLRSYEFVCRSRIKVLYKLLKKAKKFNVGNNKNAEFDERYFYFGSVTKNRKKLNFLKININKKDVDVFHLLVLWKSSRPFFCNVFHDSSTDWKSASISPFLIHVLNISAKWNDFVIIANISRSGLFTFWKQVKIAVTVQKAWDMTYGTPG
jgi:hypothetical protein